MMKNTKITLKGLLPLKGKRGQYHVVGTLGGMDFCSMTPKTIEQLAKDLGTEEAALKRLVTKD